MVVTDSNLHGLRDGQPPDISPEEITACLASALWLLQHGLIEQPSVEEADTPQPVTERLPSLPPAKGTTDPAKFPPPFQTPFLQSPVEKHPELLQDKSSTSQEENPSLGLAVPCTDTGGAEKRGCGVALGVPAVRALPAARELARSLRPLRQRTDSRTERELDIAATVELRADRGTWQPVWRPVRERWLDLVLVCDTAKTMILWRDTLKEWQLLCQQLGAFRDVRVWSLDTQDADKPTLSVVPGGPPRETKELVAPGRARLIVLATDCLGPAWFSGKVAGLLDEWGRHQPVAILQMLPNHMWDRTALALAQEMPVGASQGAVGNARLPTPWAGRERHSVPCPVMTFETDTLHTWASLVRGTLPPKCPAVALPLDPHPRRERPSTSAELTAMERIERFAATSSEEAFRLACLLAAAPLRLPVMRLVQQAMMKNPSQIHLAEFYLGGLIQRTSAADVTDPNLIEYSFRPGVREDLLNSAKVADLVNVQLEVSNYLRTRFGQLLEFDAILVDSNAATDTDKVNVQPENAIFAQVAAEVLVRLGGRHAKAVQHLRELGGLGPGSASSSPPPKLPPPEMPAETASFKKRGYQNAKIVLAGDSGVGKSGLALRLWHDRWHATESTHGMEIQRLVLPGTEADPEVTREVWLWDLAGQPDYRLTHQAFMDQTALALLVFDPLDDKLFDTIGYWQKALEKVTRAERMQIILVAARCDRSGLRWSEQEMREWATERGLHGPVLTAAKLKNHSGVDELRSLIEKLIPWDKMEFRSTTESFSALKDAILAVRGAAEAEGGVVVTPAELEARVRATVPRLTFASGDLRAVTGLLLGEGVLHALPYADLIVLQPSWVNFYASTLVKLAGEDPHHLGHVPVALIQPGKLPHERDRDAGAKASFAPSRRGMDTDRRLTEEDERQLLPALVALFLQRALAWKEETRQGPVLVFPSYVRRPHPSPPKRPGSTVQYRFTGPLEEIYCTLVVRFHHSGLFPNADTKLYRKAVDFHTYDKKLVALTMREEGERGELEIYFDSGLDIGLQATIQRFVDDHLNAKASERERLRHYFCPKCHEEMTNRKAIDAAKAKGRTKLVCNYCDPDDRPGIIDLNDLLEQQLNNAGEAGADQARRAAREGITTASMEGIMVGEVQTLVFSVDQIYRTVAQPDLGVDGEIEFRDKKTKRATGETFRVQLRSGKPHLTMRKKDGAEIFTLKPHHGANWTAKGEPDVLLIIRTEHERTGTSRLRFMNATKAIRAAQKASPGKKVTQIVFKGEDFTAEAVLRLRDERLA